MTRVFMVIAALVCAGCTWLVGDLEGECVADAECVGRAPGAVCVEGLCVVPSDLLRARCRAVYGPGESVATSSPTIALAAPLPLSGPDGPSVHWSMRAQAMGLAVEEINRRGGVGTSRQRLQLRVCDTRGSEADLLTLSDRLIAEHGALALLAGDSADLLSVKAIAVPRKVLVMGVASTSPEISGLQDDGLVWRVAASEALEGAALAHLLKDKGVTRVVVVAASDASGVALERAFVERFGQAGVTVRKFDAGTSADSPEGRAVLDGALDEAAAAQPEALVLFAGRVQLPHLLAGRMKPGREALREAGLYLSGSAHDAALLEGAAAEGMAGAFGTSPAAPSGQVFDAFRGAFLVRTGKDPIEVDFTAHAYDAVYLVALGAAGALGAEPDAPLSGPRIAQGLTLLGNKQGERLPLGASSFSAMEARLGGGALIDVEGASGPLDFDANGDVPAAVEVWQVVAGTFSTVAVLPPQ